MWVYNPADSHVIHSQLRWKACHIQWGMGVFWWQRLCICAYTVSKMTGGCSLSYDYSKVKPAHTSKWILKRRWICTLLNHKVKKHWMTQKNKKGESVRLQCVQNSVRKETQTTRDESLSLLKSWKPDLTWDTSTRYVGNRLMWGHAERPFDVIMPSSRFMFSEVKRLNCTLHHIVSQL